MEEEKTQKAKSDNLEYTLGRVKQAPTQGRISQKFSNEEDIELLEKQNLLLVSTKMSETQDGGKSSKVVAVEGNIKRV